MTTQTQEGSGKNVTTSAAATPKTPTPPALSEAVVDGKRIVKDAAPATTTTTETKPKAGEASTSTDDGKTTESTASSDEGDDSTTGDDSTAEAPKKSKGGFQKKIDKLTRENRETQRQLTTALQTIERLTGTKASDAQAAIDNEDPRPKREDYDDPDKYTEELGAWSGRRAARAERTAQEAKDREAAAKNAMTEAQRAYEKLVDAGREEYEDWEDVAESGVQVSHAMAYAITRSKHGHHIQYYLGKHPEEAERIVALKDSADQMLEIGKLEAKAVEAARKKVSRTPTPPRPLGSGNSATDKPRTEMTMSEYAAARQPELDAERRGRAGRGRSH